MHAQAADLSRALGGEHVESALEAGARRLHEKFLGGTVEPGEDENGAPLSTRDMAKY